jgi:tetratricopeptide (TPR) repeat protein
MAKYLYFSLLWALTGSPLTALLVLVAVWVVTDCLTFGFFRRGLRFVARARRGIALERLLAVNPHDRRARAEYGEILIEQRRAGRAIEVLKPALEKEPDDLELLYLTGLACLRAGHGEKGELFLNTVLEADPTFRQGQALLEMGRARLELGDAKGAEEMLGRWLEKSPAHVEGRYLQAKAHAALGDAAAAARSRERCWREYATEPAFQRRFDRPWAWRIRPARPLTYCAIALALLLAIGWAVRSSSGRLANPAGAWAEPAERNDEAPEDLDP